MEPGEEVDRFGNTLTKKDAAAREEEAALQAARLEAKARREAKAAARAETSGTTRPLSRGGPSLDALRAKAASGQRMSSKEKRLLEDLERKARLEAELAAAPAAVGGAAAEDEGDLFGVDLARDLEALDINVQGGGDDGGGGDGRGGGSSAVDIVVHRFSVSAPGRSLLEDATLHLTAGRRYGLLGKNGCGKSTLLRLLAAGKLPLPAGVKPLIVAQEIRGSSHSVIDQVVAANQQRAALLSEERTLLAAMEAAEGSPSPEGFDWMAACDRLVIVGEELKAMGAHGAEADARRILTSLGFTRAMQNGASAALSGGWRMRAALAAALHVRPPLLLLDEASAHLDLEGAIWLGDHLANHWKGTVVAVSHDMDFVEEACTDLLLLHNRSLIHSRGGAEGYAKLRSAADARARADYDRQQSALNELKSKGVAGDKALKRLGVPSLLPPPKPYKVALDMEAAEGDEYIAVSGVSFGHAAAAGGTASRELFAGLDFRVSTSTRAALVGPNGSGKTTLARLLTGELQPTAGEVTRSRRLRLGYFAQHCASELPHDATPVRHLEDMCQAQAQDARRQLGSFGLDGAHHLVKMGHLSGGQKARVLLARIALSRPHVLVLDEPSNALDLETVDALIQALKRFRGGVVLITHDARLVSALDCELWVCGEGPTGLRVDAEGFDAYRRGLLKRVHQRAAMEAAEAEQRAAKDRRETEERIRRIRDRRGRAASASASASVPSR